MSETTFTPGTENDDWRVYRDKDGIIHIGWTHNEVELTTFHEDHLGTLIDCLVLLRDNL